ncbi:uncharacterized protein [Garra rufa]|uniref:uncharacterized protein n=1 Tax=Garra rufa TaxID=137080 RepID=UPI003CCEF6E0
MADSNETTLNVYATDSMIYWDQEMTQPVAQTLYQREGDGTLYMDQDFTIALQIVSPSSVSAKGDTTTEELPQNQVFSRDQTLFLIDLMRQHLLKDNSELPRNLAELNTRIRMGRGKKRLFWQDIAAKLSQQFHQNFEIEKVSRKWTTLEDAYKKAIDSNASTGRAPTKFHFLTEMSELIGGNHDVDFPVIGTAKGVIVRRPDIIKQTNQTPQSANSSTEEGLSSPNSSFDAAQSCDSESSGSFPSQAPAHSALGFKRKRKHQVDKSEMIGFLQECEVASQRRHEEIMEQIKTTNALFEKLLQSRQQE